MTHDGVSWFNLHVLGSVDEALLPSHGASERKSASYWRVEEAWNLTRDSWRSNLTIKSGNGSDQSACIGM